MKKSLALFTFLAIVLTGCALSDPISETPTEEPEVIAPEVNIEDYFTVEVRDNPSDLTPKAWLDEEYMDYSGGWAWDYTDNLEINGQTASLARRDEQAMTITYYLFPKDSKLCVLKSENADFEKLDEVIESYTCE